MKTLRMTLTLLLALTLSSLALAQTEYPQDSGPRIGDDPAEVVLATRPPLPSRDVPPAAADHPEPPPPDRRFLHGFRIGYSYILNTAAVAAWTGVNPLDGIGLRSPHLFTLGYEAFYRLVGHDWLNVLMVGNVMVSGLEQSKFLPSLNGLLGFEFNNSFQVGVGVNLAPTFTKTSHMVIAAGWTPRVGSFYVPVHIHFIPDVDTAHRMGVTFGVTW